MSEIVETKQKEVVEEVMDNRAEALVKEHIQVKARKPEKGKRLKKLIIYGVALLLVVLITNPGMVFFLPKSVSGLLTKITGDLFGDISSIGKVVDINWLSICQLAVMIVAVLFLYELVRWAMDFFAPKNDASDTVKDILESCLKYVAAIGGICWGLSIIGVDLSTIFASLGILALIIGFGAESLIADVVTGLFLLFERQYKKRDVIEVDGFRGTVVNMTIRTTSIEDAGGNIKIINNSNMRNIINQSSDTSRAVCDIPIPYTVDLEDAEKEIKCLLKELKQENEEIFLGEPRYAGVQQLAANGVFLRIVAEVKEENRFRAARMINRKLKIGLAKANLGMNAKL